MFYLWTISIPSLFWFWFSFLLLILSVITSWFSQFNAFDFLLVLLVLLLEELDGSKKHHLDKGNQLAEDQPVVNHLYIGCGGQALHLADEDGGHHQHGGQVHTQCCLKEEGLEEGSGVGDHHEEEGGEVGGHHLTHDLSLQCDCHSDSSIFLFMDEAIISDCKQYHV